MNLRGNSHSLETKYTKDNALVQISEPALTMGQAVFKGSIVGQRWTLQYQVRSCSAVQVEFFAPDHERY
jgi:hypothetical protein